jgi:hypothetical protein
MMVVLLAHILLSESWMFLSVCVSNALVASSSRTIVGAFSNVLAIATLCFSPLSLNLARPLGVVGVGEREDLVVDVGPARRLDHVGIRRREATVLDVVADGVVEEDGVLGDHPYGPTQRLLGDGFDVLPVDDDRARLDVVEPEQQPNYGALAAPGRTNLRNKRSKPTFRFGLSDSPHQSHSLPWGHRERDVLQHQSLGQVPEGHVVKLHRAPLHRDRPALGASMMSWSSLSKSNMFSMSTKFFWIAL